MERESFEDEEAAEVLNKNFVSIKVDREERPDVDNIYMMVCQTVTGRGGWPLTIIMTPDQKPFFAGTYFPKHDRMGMQGLISILDSINDIWRNERDAILDAANQIMEGMNINNRFSPGDIEEDVIKEAFNNLQNAFDTEYGGFGRGMKFPTPHNLYFLLRYWYVTKESSALKMVEKTLDAMARGGIHDHIGGGFSRYSTDPKWLVPHFEKMLYDNALLAIAYLETYQVTKSEKYAVIAEKILSYVKRDMISENGGFYSAEDADSEGVEGKFYVWTADEIKEVLGEADGQRYSDYYDITPQGNFEGKNIPNLIKHGIKIEEAAFIENCNQKLFKYREKRVKPHKDDKILTSWNGLMIAAFAYAGRVLKNQDYINIAENAVDFIYKNLVIDEEKVLARYRDGEASSAGYVDDYAFLTWGIIELYEAAYNVEFLKKALKLTNSLIKYFWDKSNGGLFVYGSDSEKLIIRPKEIYDGATPSGNSVSALNLLRLSRITGQSQLEERAYEILKAFSDDIKNAPSAYTFALLTLTYMKNESNEVVIVSDKDDNSLKSMIDILNSEFRPFTSVISFLSNLSNDKSIMDVVPNIADYKSINGLATAYVCENHACRPPVTDLQQFNENLRGLQK